MNPIIRKHIKGVSLWLGYYPMWQRGGLAIWENGGRNRGECFDLSFQIWKYTGSVTVWDMDRLSRIVGILPSKKLSVGIFAKGQPFDDEVVTAE